MRDFHGGHTFVRLLRARDLRLGTVGALLAERISYAINRYYGADIEAHWYIGQYVLPGSVQRIILKPKALPLRTLGISVSACSSRYRQSSDRLPTAGPVRSLSARAITAL